MTGKTPNKDQDEKGGSDIPVEDEPDKRVGGEQDLEPGTSESIKDMILEYDEQESLIQDRSLLDPNEVVDEERIVGRDDQLTTITKKLRVAIGEARPPNLFLYGPSGTGKSLIINAVCNNLRELCESRNINFGVIEMNCQDLGTLDEAVFELGRIAAEEANDIHDVAENGVGTKQKWKELYRIISDNFDTVVFVLDELDMLVGRKRRGSPVFSDLLYQLSRAGNSNDIDAKVSVAVLTNDTKMMEDVGSRALSSFNPEDVKFNDYDANQLQSILRHREDAFAEGALDEDVIPLAAAFAAQTHGDARKAIDLIRVAGNNAEEEKASTIGEHHIRQAQDEVERNRVLEVTRGISTQKKLCLYATAAVARETKGGKAKSSDAYAVYQFVTDAIDADQHHQETYVNKMKELTTYSIVEGERKSGGYKAGMYIEFTFGENPDTILETLSEDSRVGMLSTAEVRSMVKKQLNNQSLS